MAVSNEYLIGVKRELKDALEDAIKAHPETMGRKTKVALEFPMSPQQYPAIFITFSEGPISNAGIGHYELDEQLRVVKHWVFNGAVNFTVLGESPYDRDLVANDLLNILAFGNEIPEFKQFHDDLKDADFISMVLNTETINPGGENQMSAPWAEGQEEFLYTRTYTVDAFGEFYSDPTTSGFVQINLVQIYPYLKGEEIPQGSQHPSDADIPWIS